VRVQARHVELTSLAGAGGDDGSTLVAHVEHQPGGLLTRIAEQLLEHVHDVGHQVDRIVPDDHDPGNVRDDVFVAHRAFGLDRGGLYHAVRVRVPIADRSSRGLLRDRRTPE